MNIGGRTPFWFEAMAQKLFVGQHKLAYIFGDICIVWPLL